MQRPSRPAKVPPTVAHDAALTAVSIGGARLHVALHGDATRPLVIVVHGGPGGDFRYLLGLAGLAPQRRVLFYDQRGTGLSERRPDGELTLEQNLDDLAALIELYGAGRPACLIGHSWGAMLAVALAARQPDRVQAVIAVEPGMLHEQAAREFVTRLRAAQSWRDALLMLGDIARSSLVRSRDGHERFDFVMTRQMNRGTRGGPYQCEGEGLPAGIFVRAGFRAFSTMLRPILAHPEAFGWDLCAGLEHYRGRLLFISSSCSFIGHDFQQRHHLPRMPSGTPHVCADAMGHNMLTLNPEWSLRTIGRFLDDAVPAG